MRLPWTIHTVRAIFAVTFKRRSIDFIQVFSDFDWVRTVAPVDDAFHPFRAFFRTIQ
ncbi:Uncharacterised protein [Vibrio cholerae]|nr:Uncharacterised protein [Vibrio cholerae]